MGKKLAIILAGVAATSIGIVLGVLIRSSRNSHGPMDPEMERLRRIESRSVQPNYFASNGLFGPELTDEQLDLVIIDLKRSIALAATSKEQVELRAWYINNYVDLLWNTSLYDMMLQDAGRFLSLALSSVFKYVDVKPSELSSSRQTDLEQLIRRLGGDIEVQQKIVRALTGAVGELKIRNGSSEPMVETPRAKWPKDNPVVKSGGDAVLAFRAPAKEYSSQAIWLSVDGDHRRAVCSRVNPYDCQVLAEARLSLLAAKNNAFLQLKAALENGR